MCLESLSKLFVGGLNWETTEGEHRVVVVPDFLSARVGGGLSGSMFRCLDGALDTAYWKSNIPLGIDGCSSIASKGILEDSSSRALAVMSRMI